MIFELSFPKSGRIRFNCLISRKHFFKWRPVLLQSMNKNFSNSSVCYFDGLKIHAATHKFEAKSHIKTNYLKKNYRIVCGFPGEFLFCKKFCELAISCTLSNEMFDCRISRCFFCKKFVKSFFSDVTKFRNAALPMVRSQTN